ncbi:MAG: tyrosine--tRNA ligase [Patescibacteria group bacterium]
MSNIIIDKQKIEELLTRGVENIYPNRDFLEKLLYSGKRLTLYTGYDPTAPTLHIGHSITMLKLRQFQELGHKVIMLIGDFTGMVGDPMDKTATRKQLTRQQVLENCKEYKKQSSAILDFKGKNPVELKYNSKWLAKMNFAEVLELASHFTVQQMLERDMFQERIKQNKPVYIHEFMYPLMQGYDSVMMDVDGEVGGNDQTFNMLAGRTLIKELKNKEKFVLTTKLLTDASGKKMGKSEGNMIALSDSSQDMFGKVMSWSDDLIVNGFILCTRLPELEIKKFEQDLKSGVNPRDLKIKLAEEIVKIYYGEKLATVAKEKFNKIFSERLIPEDIKTEKVDRGSYKLVDIIFNYKLASSRGEARRLIEQGGVEVNQDIIKDWQAVVNIESSKIIKVGKRRFLKLDPK